VLAIVNSGSRPARPPIAESNHDNNQLTKPLVATSASQLLCESYDGTFTNTNLSPPDIWRCTGPFVSSLGDFNTKVVQLRAECFAEGGGFFGGIADPPYPTTAGFFVCAH
jgi:hypothetical protein